MPPFAAWVIATVIATSPALAGRYDPSLVIGPDGVRQRVVHYAYTADECLVHMSEIGTELALTLERIAAAAGASPYRSPDVEGLRLKAATVFVEAKLRAEYLRAVAEHFGQRNGPKDEARAMKRFLMSALESLEGCQLSLIRGWRFSIEREEERLRGMIGLPPETWQRIEAELRKSALHRDSQDQIQHLVH